MPLVFNVNSDDNEKKRDTSVAGQLRRITESQSQILITRKHIKDTCFSFPFAQIYIIVSVNDDHTANLVKSGGDEYEFSYTSLPGDEVASNLFKLDSKASGQEVSLQHVPSIKGGVSSANIGDSVQVGFYDSSRQKPYIRRIVKKGSITIHDGVTPNTPQLRTTAWPQSMGSVRKDWWGNTALDYSSSTLKVATKADWPNLFTLEGDPHKIKNSESLWPSVLLLDEYFTNVESTDPANHLQTLAVLSNKRNGFGVEGNLQLYRVTSRTDETTARTEINSINPSVAIDLPYPAWAIAFDPFNAYMLPNVSNGYARGFNETILPPDYEDFYPSFNNVHFTFISPCIMDSRTGLADTTGAGLVTIIQSFFFTLDGIPQTVTLNFKAENILEVHSGDGTQDFGDQFSEYTLRDVPDNNLVDVTPLDVPDGEGHAFGNFYIKYQYSNGGASEQFTVLEGSLTRRREHLKLQTSTLPSVRANAEHHNDPEDDLLPGTWTWKGYIGSAHVSVGMNVMIQGHIASDKVKLYWKPAYMSETYYGWMYWFNTYTSVWEALIPEVDNETILPAWKFFDMGANTNNSPAKIKDVNIYPYTVNGEDQPGETELLADAFVMPYFTFFGEKFPTDMSNYGGTFTSKYWIVKVMMRDNGEVSSQAIKLLERTNPTSGDLVSLTSLDDSIAETVKSVIETGFGIILDHTYNNERYYGYSCPVVTDCIFTPYTHTIGGFWGPNVNGCSDPCWVECGEDPNSHGCFCWDYDSTYDPEIGVIPGHQILLGVNTTTYKWGGYLLEPVTDYFGTTYPAVGTPAPEKQGINNIIIPLPLMTPNQSPNEFSKCTWTAKSTGTNFSFVVGTKDAVDPQLAVSETDGMIYSCIIEGSYIYVPTGEGFLIQSYQASGPGGEGSGSGDWDGGPETPDPESELCRMDYVYTEFYAVAGGCENCMQGERDPETGIGGWNYFVPPEPRSVVVTLPSTQGVGNTYDEFTAYGTKRVKEVRETKLVISSKDGSSVLTVPISKKFTGVPYSILGRNYTITEELPVPENVWQIGLWKGYVIILIDDRDYFNYSPRPILQIRDRFTGAKVAEYKTIVPDDLYNTRWPSDDPFRSYMTKWNMYGRLVGQGFYGPRFKLAYMVDQTETTGDENKPLYIHISNEIYSIPESFVVDYTSKGRVDYRILKFDGTDLTEVKNVFEEKEQMFSSGTNLDVEIQFPEKYPRPGALGSMAITRNEVFLPVISSAEGDDDDKTWTMISHQIETTP